MFRSLPVWLLASGLAAFVGCGGGAATDSGTVAEKSSDAAPAGGGGAAMPSGGAGMGAPESTGMGAPGSSDMMGTAGGAGMSAEMYGAGAGAADPAAEMNMEGFGPGGENSTTPGLDPAKMAAAYGAGAGEGALSAGTGTPEDMAANYAGAGADGAYPGGANPNGANPAVPGAGAFPGGEYPGGPGGPGTGGGAVEEKVPEGFDGKAQLAFRRGKEKDALQYLYAHALTTDAGAESLLPTIRWVSGLRQPKLAVRWGAGFVQTAPRNFTGDPKPVGSEQTIPTRGGNRKGGGGNEGYVGGGGGADYGAGGGGDGGGGGANNSLLSKKAGELGDKLAAAYTERVMRGDFGEVLKQAAEGSSGGNRGNSGGAGTAGYGGAAAAGYGAGAGAEGAATFGAPRGSGPGGGGLRGGGAAATATQVTQIMPGLSMLGIGTQKELIERAREDGIDAVVIIEVKLQVNTKTGLVTNESTLALYDTKPQKKPFHTTKKFNNIAIQKLRAEGKEDGVDKELEKLFEAIDANFKMTDFPAGLNAESAANRVAGLAKEKHDNPLPILAEARMYHTKGLLEESALFAAYEQILGVDFGRLLATGQEEDKKKVLNQWLPES